jgi:hypothetical protein
MTANIATTQSMSLAAGAARSVADTRTPFYNNLMTMIDATALENRRVSHDPEATGILPTASHGEHGLRWADSTSGWVSPRWSVGQVLTCAAGAIAAVAVVGAIVGSVGGIKEQPVVAADSSAGRTPLMVASTVTVDKAVERASPPASADAPASTGSKAKEAAESGTETVAVPAAKLEAPPDAKPAAGPPESESPGAGPNAERVSAAAEATADVKTVSVKIVAVTAAIPDVDDVADPPVPKQAAGPDVVAPAELPPAKQPRPADKAVSPAPPLETGSIGTGATGKAPDTVRIGRIASGVRMRAGPSNAEPVLGTLPKGAAVEVVGCRAWCEVLFNGQRGWIYKSFLAGPR